MILFEAKWHSSPIEAEFTVVQVILTAAPHLRLPVGLDVWKQCGFHFSIRTLLTIQLIPVLCLGTDFCFVKTDVSAWKKTLEE